MQARIGTVNTQFHVGCSRLSCCWLVVQRVRSEYDWGLSCDASVGEW